MSKLASTEEIKAYAKKGGLILAAFVFFLLFVLSKNKSDVRYLKETSNKFVGVVKAIEQGKSKKLKNCYKISYEWKDEKGKIHISNNSLPMKISEKSKWLSHDRWHQIGSPKVGSTINVYKHDDYPEPFLYFSTIWKN